MLLRVQTEVSGDVFILRCDGRIVFGDEGAVLRDRVINMLSGTPKIVVNLNGVDYIDSGGFGILVGLFISAKTAAEIKHPEKVLCLSFVAHDQPTEVLQPSEQPLNLPASAIPSHAA